MSDSQDDNKKLTTAFGAPVPSNENVQTAGPRGPLGPRPGAGAGTARPRAARHGGQAGPYRPEPVRATGRGRCAVRQWRGG